MREFGTESWRFAHDLDQSLHCVLYVRDAIGLRVADQPGNPPRLAGDIPDRSQLLDPEASAEAAARWPSWWRAVLAQHAISQLGSSVQGSDHRARLRELGARHRLVVDPPEWASLADGPALQQAARALWVEGCRWFDSAEASYRPESGQVLFAWDQTRDGAERAAAEHDVRLGEINGCASVLLVEGSWWTLSAPGAALCSITSARDAATVPAILKAVFDSHLAR